MANAITNTVTSRASLSAPTIKKPSFFARLFRAIIESRQREADAAIARYLARTGYKLTDDVEREIERRLFRSNMNFTP
jgi:hypothetical protein